MQKDLNLFNIYKASSSKNSGGSFKSIIIVSISFILLVLIAFGALFIININLQNTNNQIKNYLAMPEVVKAQSEFTSKSTQNKFMNKYKSALTTAKESFDKSRFIDSKLLGAISSSLPADVQTTNINVTQLFVTLNCTSTDKMAPAILTQALSSKDLFASITYDGISLNKDVKTGATTYTFNLKCDFKEVTSK